MVEIVAIGIFSLILTYSTFTKERTGNISLALESNKLKTVVIPGDIHKKRITELYNLKFILFKILN